MTRRWLTRIAFAVVVLAGSMGHGGGGCCHGTPSSIFGPPTETVCPPTSTLTYTNFGQAFMESYCVQCHHSELVGAERQGAPSFHDFDTLFGIKAVADHIDQTTAIGPAASNTSMPPAGEPQPSTAEREMLAEWIACDMPM